MPNSDKSSNLLPLDIKFHQGVVTMITLEQIQKRLAEAIKESGMSQTDIARALKINQSNISHYIKGDKMPALDTFANLCKLLDIDTNYILFTE